MKKFVVIQAFALFAVYYFVSPQQIPQENFFTAKQELLFNEASIEPAVNTQEIITPLKVFQRGLVYLSTPFRLAYRAFVDSNFRSVVGNPYFALYNSNNTHMGFNLYNVQHSIQQNNYPPGDKGMWIGDEGLPFIFGKRIYTVIHKAGLIKCYQPSGEIAWSYNIGAYVTALCANEELTFCGGANGCVTLFDIQGQKLFEYKTSGSTIEMIYGVAISPNGQYLAVICGLSPQRFILFRKGNNTYLPIYHHNLTYESIRPVRIKFAQNNDLVLYEEKNYLNGLQIKGQKEFRLSVAGVLKDFYPDILNDYLGFLTEENEQTTLGIVHQKYLFPLMDLPIQSCNIALTTLPNSIILGVDETLFALCYERET